MNRIKKLLGILWIITGPVVIYFLITESLKANDKALTKIASAATNATKDAAYLAKTNANLQWGIIITIFIPVMIGLVIFGYYAIKDEYNHLPTSSAELA